MSNNIRLRTTPGGGNKNINVSINQDFDFIEILSLKISQDEAYRRFSSDYGAVVGRVIVNNGVGVPNAKVSIFIPVDEEDKLDPEIFGLYPYETVTDKNSEGMSYSLLPSSNNGKSECYSTVGSFDSKRQIQDNPESEEIYCKYYKFTTTTNNSGDYMIFGIPVGSHSIHVEADLSDIGFLSQKPYNMINEGSSENLFKSPNQFKGSSESVAPIQAKKVSPVSVNVIPFWGDKEQFEIGITRLDVDLLINITPTALFMGSAITDNEKNSINKNCRPRKKLGKMDELITGPGTIEMIRKTITGSIEPLNIDGGQLIDDNGVWCYQIPMNIGYKITSESGDLIDSPDGKTGIPTRTDVRFRIGMEVNGTEGRLRRRAKYLVPHNPDTYEDSDYTFDTTTKQNSFKTLSWNKIYTIKNHISRVQPNKSVENRNFIGIKSVDDPGTNSPFPYNKMDSKGNPLFLIIMAILGLLTFLIWFLNRTVLYALNVFLLLFVRLFWSISKLGCFLKHPAPTSSAKKKRAGCRCWRLYKLSDGSQGDVDCANSYYPLFDSNGEPIEDLPDDNNDLGNADDCDKNDCKTYQPDAVIPYIKMSCDGEKYFIWDLTGQDGVCDDLNNEGGQQVDCNGGTNGEACVSTSASKYLECNAVVIGDALNVFKFDFYNDWVNGSLYLFLLKYKFNRTAKEKFCDIDCDEDELGDYSNDGKADNNCRNNFILDTCTGVDPQNADDGGFNFNKTNTKKTVKIEEGYIKRGLDGELYYAAFSKNQNYKMFATDIVSLGSINEFDWEGKPQIYKFLTNTTFQIPPSTDELNENNPSVVDVAGLTGRDNLMFSWSISYTVGGFGVTATANNRQCNNIKRICELGVGLDENREDEFFGPADGKIANNDVDNPFVRGLFKYANSTTTSTSVSEVLFDSNNGSLEGNFVDYLDPEYSEFRDVNQQDIWQYDNSYYFYFGLNSSNTALTKLVKDYLTPCDEEIDNTFQCISNTIIQDGEESAPTGSIIADVIGGIKPLQYTWTGPEINGVTYPQPSNIINSDSSTEIIELYAGTYDLTVVDSVGNKTSCAFQVGGPLGVSCNIDFSEPTAQGNSDGEIEVSVNGGIPPYTYELEDSSGTIISQQSPTVSTSHTFTGLIADSYLVRVLDSSTIQTECEQFVLINEPNLPTVSVTKIDVDCFGSNNGSATGIIQDTNGGGNTQIEWEYPDGSTVTGTTNIFNLGPGSYTLTYTDSLGQVVDNQFTIDEPSDITIDPIILSGSSGYVVSFTVNGGTEPYDAKLYDYDSTTTPGLPPIQILSDINAGLNTFAVFTAPPGVGVIDITDSNGCNKELIIDLP